MTYNNKQMRELKVSDNNFLFLNELKHDTFNKIQNEIILIK